MLKQKDHCSRTITGASDKDDKRYSEDKKQDASYVSSERLTTRLIPSLTVEKLECSSSRKATYLITNVAIVA